jgi:hypothetical protein
MHRRQQALFHLPMIYTLVYLLITITKELKHPIARYKKMTACITCDEKENSQICKESRSDIRNRVNEKKVDVMRSMSAQYSMHISNISVCGNGSGILWPVEQRQRPHRLPGRLARRCLGNDRMVGLVDIVLISPGRHGV